MDSSLFYGRRQNLLSLCEEGSMLLLFANADRQHIFIQDSNFFYLTGLNIPEAILMIFKRGGKLHEKIFIERTIEEKIVWDGAKMSKEEVRAISGIEDVYYLDRFDEEISKLLAAFNNVLTKRVYIEGTGLQLNEGLNKSLIIADKIRKRYPAIKFDYLCNILNPLRMKKDDWEITQMKKAVDLTRKGLLNVLKSKIAGENEYQIEARIHFAMINEGVRTWAFKPIVASGKNATILHYNDNNRIIEDNVLLLLDVGASYNNYCADITRTYPSGLKFKKRQKDVYSEVLEVQKSIINIAEPGITLRKLNETTQELLTESLFRLKLIKDKKELKKYYMHSVSHFLGMQAHDVGSKDSILEPGNVITVEPGLYIAEEGIGVRIEDDVLITEKGREVLSDGIPKEIEEIEELRAKMSNE